MRFELRETHDGSLTVFDHDAGECFKSRHAARTEAEHVFYVPGVVEHPSFPDRPLDVVELGFGLGTNFQYFLSRRFRGTFRTIERDLSGAEFYVANVPDADLSSFLAAEKFTRGEFRAFLHRGDFFAVLRSLVATDARADVILFDPFSPKANPEAWTRELFTLAYSLLRPGGRLVTYSVSRQAKDAASGAGFHLTKRKLPPELHKRSALLAIRPETA